MYRKRRRQKPVQGVVEDIKQIIQPRDAQGNLLPVTTVEIALNNEATLKIGLVVFSAIFLNKMIN